MSAKKKDEKNRWRNKTIAFRGSPEEAEELDKRWRLCGYPTKQDYIIDAVIHQRIVAKGNPQMLFQFRSELRGILTELERIQNASEMDEELLTPIRTMLEIMEAFRENETEDNKEENRKFLKRRVYRNV